MTALQKRKTTAFRFGLWKVGKARLMAMHCNDDEHKCNSVL